MIDLVIFNLELAHIRANLQMLLNEEQSVRTTYEDIVESVDWVIEVFKNTTTVGSDG